ncbi:MAG: hypothetical protein KGZ93_00015 [Actinobacteria bacterium]|nr:hypothetical protein [Actinomycetota bacterium]
MRSLYWRISLSLLLLLLLPATAFALPYGEAAYATNSTGSITTAWGTFAKNWVMDNPTLQSPDGQHVNSIYIRYDSKNIIEIGWYRSYPSSSTNPQGFTVRLKNDVYEFKALGAMTKGTYANFQINNVPGTYSFETWINGVRMYTWTNSGFTSGRTRVGAERRYGGSGGDTNYANFQELKYKGSSGAWGYWYKINDEYLGGQEDVWYDVFPNDAAYSLIIDRNS